ncbi:ISL3 family transposase [Streptomyces sp. NPDC012617]|uniref:ISL3 family transposase n=1 Tax=Streptomyces TaxID=1883 RepID=UPI0033EE0808
MIRPQCGVADSSARGRSSAPAGGVTVPVDRGRGCAVGRRERRSGTYRGPERGGRVRLPWLWKLSRRIHSSYLRFPADVPSGGRRVVLCLRVRRFLCPVISCGRRTFAEQMPGLTRRYGRRTERLRSTLAAVGLALAGRAGARMARVFGLSVSRSTVLRLVESLPDPQVPAPRVVGVDEYATRKGRHYGTVLIDVESRRPVDLLPDREASSLAAWLAKRPGVEVVCRDRAPFFAEGATAGAPQAVQVADRWHLWHNLSEAAERCVADHRGCLRVLAPDPAQPAPELQKFEDPSGSPWPRGHRFADRTRANHATVHELLTAGLRPPSPRVVAGWILRRPETLPEIDHLRLKAVLVHCPELDALTTHVRSFAQMLTERQGERLPQWLDAVRRDDLPSLHTLAAGIERDRYAVIAGLTLPWNSGVVEGHVNRIKMLERQMFGRAGFALLRKRVLLAS